MPPTALICISDIFHSGQGITLRKNQVTRERPAAFFARQQLYNVHGFPANAMFAFYSRGDEDEYTCCCHGGEKSNAEASALSLNKGTPANPTVST